MPMLVFWAQMGLGTIVLALAFFNGPDPLEKWTGLDASMLIIAIIVGTAVGLVAPSISSFFESSYGSLGLGMLAGFLVLAYAAGWRLLAFICAAMCAFCLL